MRIFMLCFLSFILGMSVSIIWDIKDHLRFRIRSREDSLKLGRVLFKEEDFPDDLFVVVDNDKRAGSTSIKGLI